MELNRDAIKKALECCTNKRSDGLFDIKCEECPFEIGKEDCKDLDEKALALINELTAENKLLDVELGNANFEILRLIEEKKELTEENERLTSLCTSKDVIIGDMNAENERLEKNIETYRGRLKLREKEFVELNNINTALVQKRYGILSNAYLTFVGNKRTLEYRVQVGDEYDLIKEAKADTVRKMQNAVAVHFGTYTDKDTVKVSDVFRLLDRIAHEILEGGTDGGK